MNLEILRIVLIVIMLAIASYFDIFNKRHIDVRISQIFGVIGVGLLLFDNPWGWINVALIVSVTVIIGTVFYLIGIWGGADLKLIIAISLIQPFWSSPFPFEKLTFHPFVSFGVLANAALLSALIMLPVVIKKKTFKLTIPFVPYMLIGYLILILKGDLMTWIVKYGNMFL